MAQHSADAAELRGKAVASAGQCHITQVSHHV